MSSGLISPGNYALPFAAFTFIRDTFTTTGLENVLLDSAVLDSSALSWHLIATRLTCALGTLGPIYTACTRLEKRFVGQYLTRSSLPFPTDKVPSCTGYLTNPSVGVLEQSRGGLYSLPFQ